MIDYSRYVPIIFFTCINCGKLRAACPHCVVVQATDEDDIAICDPCIIEARNDGMANLETMAERHARHRGHT